MTILSRRIALRTAAALPALALLGACGRGSDAASAPGLNTDIALASQLQRVNTPPLVTPPELVPAAQDSVPQAAPAPRSVVVATAAAPASATNCGRRARSAMRRRDWRCCSLPKPPFRMRRASSFCSAITSRRRVWN